MVLVLFSKPVDFNQLLLQYNFIAIKNDVTPKVKKLLDWTGKFASL